MKVLDIGCGTRKYVEEGAEVVSIDFNTATSPTIVHDLFKMPWPLKESSFDKVYASHIIEHFPSTVDVMEEIYRVCKPAAKVIVRVPHFSSRSAWVNPTHYRAFTLDSLCYFNKDNAGEYYGRKCDFIPEKSELRYGRPDVKHGFAGDLAVKFFNALAAFNKNRAERVLCYYIGGFSEIYLELQARK